jgi:DnaJ-class molecular chaperone
MSDMRLIPCAACGGDGGHHDVAGHWARCVDCGGTGEEEIDAELERQANYQEECERKAPHVLTDNEIQF